MTGQQHYDRAESLLTRASDPNETNTTRAVLTARAQAHLHAADIATTREAAGLEPYGTAA